MEIAYLSDVRVPSKAASVVHVMKMCESLTKLGHNVTLFYVTTGEKLEDFFEEYGVEHEYCAVGVRKPRVRGIAYWHSMRMAWLARRRKCEFALSRNVAATAAVALLGVPAVFEAHMPTREKGALTHGLVHVLARLNKVRGLVVISHALEDYFRRSYLWTKKILVAPDAAPGRSPGSAKERGHAISIQQNGRLNVGYTGHLYRGRGIDLLAEIASRCDWIHMHIVGGEPEDVESWRNRCSGMSNITFYGHVKYAIMDAYRSECDVLVAPYQEQVIVSGGRWDTANWMSPLKVFEYMSSRRAIVSSDLPVLREVLHDGKNAILCDCDDVEQWIQALEKLYRNPEYRDRLANNAYLDYEKKYTWDKRAERIVGYYCQSERHG